MSCSLMAPEPSIALGPSRCTLVLVEWLGDALANAPLPKSISPNTSLNNSDFLHFHVA